MRDQTVDARDVVIGDGMRWCWGLETAPWCEVTNVQREDDYIVIRIRTAHGDRFAAYHPRQVVVIARRETTNNP